MTSLAMRFYLWYFAEWAAALPWQTWQGDGVWKHTSKAVTHKIMKKNHPKKSKHTYDNKNDLQQLKRRILWSVTIKTENFMICNN